MRDDLFGDDEAIRKGINDDIEKLMRTPRRVSRYDDAPRPGPASPEGFPIPGTKEIRFSGDVYDPGEDDRRLTGQILRVFDVLKDGRWRTLGEIEALTGDPQASISAQLRHLRKDRFGAHTIEKRARGDREAGLFEYRLVVHE